MSGKHTQGEWLSSVGGGLIETERKVIAKIFENWTSIEETEANRKLILASPVMLEALQDIVNYWETPQDSKSIIEHLEVIIEKAKVAIVKATE